MNEKEYEKMNELQTEEFGGKKEKKSLLLILAILLVIFLILGAFAYPLFCVKPKTVFVTTIDNLYALTNEKIDDYHSLEGTFSFESDLKSSESSTNKLLNTLNNLDLHLNYKIDYDAKNMFMEMNSFYKDKDLLQINMQHQNKKTYLFLKDIFTNYLEIPIEGMDELFAKKEIKDYQILTQQILTSLKKSLKDSYFTKEKDTVEISGESTKVNKYNLLLNQKNVTEIKQAMLKELHNEEFITSFSHIFSMSEEEVKESLEKLEKKNISLANNCTFSIYTKGIKNTFVGITYTEGNESFSIIQNEEQVFSYDIDTVDLKTKGKIKLEQKENEIEITFIFDNEDVTGTLSIQFTYQTDIKIDTIPIENARNIEHLTEQEAEEILTNLQEKEGISLLIQEVFTLFNTDFSM